MHLPTAITRILTFILALVWLSGLPRQGKAQIDPLAPPADERRFPVAHVHDGNVCRGFLYVNPRSVRYEAVRPVTYKHSFQLLRSDITNVQRGAPVGNVRNVLEIDTATASVRFWRLQSDDDVTSDRLPSGYVVAPIQPLIAALLATPTNSPLPAAGAAAAAAPARQHPPLAPDALDGIYAALHFGPGGAGIRRLNFSPDGTVIKDIPQEGMANFNPVAYRNDPRNKLFIGRYRVEGDKIAIQWGGTNLDMIKRDEKAKQFPFGAEGLDTFIPMCRCTDKRFSGRYYWGPEASGQYLQFFPDGTLFDSHITDQWIVPSKFFSNPRVQRGTYSIRDQTITASFPDGHQAKRTFIAPKSQENDPSFTWIGLGWWSLYEEKFDPLTGKSKAR